MDDQALKQRVLQKEKEWLTVMQERYFTNHRFNSRENVFLFFRLTVLESTVENKDQQYGPPPARSRPSSAAASVPASSAGGRGKSRSPHRRPARDGSARTSGSRRGDARGRGDDHGRAHDDRGHGRGAGAAPRRAASGRHRRSWSQDRRRRS